MRWGFPRSQAIGISFKHKIPIGFMKGKQLREIHEASGIYKKYDMAVSKNKGTPKWMVYDGKPY